MRRDWKIVLLLTAVTVASFWQVSQHDFVNYDDNSYVTDNPHVQAGVTRAGLAWAFGRLHGEATYWHPLTWVSHMVDCQFFHLNPAGHHLMNLFFHTLNTLLVFLVFKRLTGAYWRSAILAALFALHPLQVDTVAWVTERKNVLSTLFWLLTMWAYVRYAERPRWQRYGVVLLLYALGLMCKPVLVTLPCVLLLLDYWPLGRMTHFQASAAGANSVTTSVIPRFNVGFLVLEKVPMLALAVVSSVITVLANYGLGIKPDATGLPLLLRLENAWISYVRYLGKTIWPAKLAVFYPHPVEWQAWQAQGSLVILIAITALVLWQIRRRPYLAVGWLWFVGVLVPTSGIIQAGVQAMADRFAYVPLIGLFLMVVWGIAELSESWKLRGAIVGTATSLVLAGLIVITGRQLRHWQNSITLFEHALAVTENNYIAYNNLAWCCYRIGKLEQAQQLAAEAVRLGPTMPEFRLTRGFMLMLQGKTEPALEEYRAAVTYKRNLLPELKKLGNGLASQGKLKEAMDQYHLILKLNPNDPEVIKNLGTVCAAAGQLKEAVDQYNLVLKLDANDSEAHTLLAMALVAQKMPAEAIAHFREALRRQPEALLALNNLAWLHATHPDPQFRNGLEAVRLAEHAVQLTQRKNTFYLGTLAAAYAEAGRFADAVKCGEEARNLALAKGQKELADLNLKLLKFYQSAKPYREDLK